MFGADYILLINQPFKFLMTSFFVVPGLLLFNGDACLWTPLLPGLGKAEKLARFCESVMADDSSILVLVFLFIVVTVSLNRLLRWTFSSSFLCCSCRTRLFAFERGIHLNPATKWPFPSEETNDRFYENAHSSSFFSVDYRKMATFSCIFSVRKTTRTRQKRYFTQIQGK